MKCPTQYLMNINLKDGSIGITQFVQLEGSEYLVLLVAPETVQQTQHLDDFNVKFFHQTSYTFER